MKDFIVWLLAFRKEQNLPLWHELDFCNNVHALLECNCEEIDYFYKSNEPIKSRVEISNFNFMSSNDKAALIKNAISELVNENIVRSENFVMLA
jgi:hypothetical protein